MSPQERIADSKAAYTFALAVRRERGVRAGTFTPINDAERRQAAEGPVAPHGYDCVRCAA